MLYLKELLAQTYIDFPVMLLRLFLGFVLGGLIGLERERHKQPAGLKTHILICVGGTLLMLLSIYIPQTFIDFKNGDPGRIAAQVVTGIGFLGAGAIIRLGVNVRGITTAASIWVVAAIGLAVGAGMYGGAIACTVIILFVLLFLDVLEKKIFIGRFLRSLEIYYKGDRIMIDEILPIVRNYGIAVKTVDISQSFENKIIKMRLIVKIPERMDFRGFYEDIGKVGGVYKVDLGQNV